MEMGIYLTKGLVIGLIFGVPAGVIGVLTMKRTLEYGFFAGVATGFGSTAADLIYGCIGACGLTAVSDLLLSREWLIRMAGGAFIILYGLIIVARSIQTRTVHRSDIVSAAGGMEGVKYSCRRQEVSPKEYLILFASSFLVAITNPAAILAFVTAFASFGILDGVTAGQSLFLLLGLAVGTGSWWIALAGIASRFRERIRGKLERILNRILGVLMILFGIGAVSGGILQ